MRRADTAAPRVVVPPALAVVTFTSGAVRPTPRVIRGMVNEESELC